MLTPAGSPFDWSHEILGVLIISALGLLVLFSVDLIKRYTSIPSEVTRKLAHIVCGMVVASIPVFVDQHLAVLALSVGFVGIMVGTQLLGLLDGVHGVDRGVLGVAVFPMTAWIIFYLVEHVYYESWALYGLAIMTLACADAAAAIVGQRWGTHRYLVTRCHMRSVEGSIACAVVTALVVATSLTIAGVAPVTAALIALFAGPVVAAVEAVSAWGLDNLTIPIAAFIAVVAVNDLSDTTIAWCALAAIATVTVSFRIAVQRRGDSPSRTALAQ